MLVSLVSISGKKGLQVHPVESFMSLTGMVIANHDRVAPVRPSRLIPIVLWLQRVELGMRARIGPTIVGPV